MNTAIYTEQYKGHTIDIFQDEFNHESPDDWGNEDMFLVAYHRDFYVERESFVQKSDAQLLIASDKSLKEDVEDGLLDEFDIERLDKIKKEYFIFPLEAYIHSGIHLSIGNEGNYPDRQWDVSCIGLIFIRKDEAENQKDKAHIIAKGLLDTWNDYLSGNVYGYVIDGDGDSVWGFYGDYNKSGILDEARASVDSIDPKQYHKEQQLKKIDALRKWEQTLTTKERELISRSIKSIEKQLSNS